MRVRVVLGSLLLASVLVGGVALVVLPGSHDPGLEADATAEDDGPRDGSAGTLAAHARAEVVGAVAKAARGRIEGDVHRAGTGVAARVTLFDVSKADPGTDPSWLLEASWVWVPTEESLSVAPATAVEADAAGRFVLDDIPAGTYDLVARGVAGGAGSTRVVVACDRALAIVHVELRGGGPERLAGRVRHADGRPFRGFVVPYSIEGDYVFPREATPVALDDEGRFQLTGLDPGPMSVLAYAPGTLLVRSHAVVVPTSSEFELVVDAGFEDVRGRVVADKDGQPVAGATVLTTAWQPAGVAFVEARTVTDGDGRFRVAAEHGSTSYRVEAAGYAPLDASRWLPAGDGLEFRLVRAGKVVGRVTSKGDGAAVEGVHVYVVGGAGAAGPHAVTKADGRYEIADVPPGDVVVIAYGAGWLSDGFARATERYNPFSIPLEAGAVATVDLVVVRGARANGVVLDATGKPSAGARVRGVRRMPGNTEDNVFAFLSEAQAVATGPDGRFGLDTLAAGFSYEFHATSPNASDGEAGPLRVEADKATEVEIRLGVARFAEVVVRQKGGGPVAGLSVYAATNPDDGDWKEHARGTTGASGVLRLGPLPAGPLSFGMWGQDGYGGEDVTEGGPAGRTDPIHVEFVVERSYAIAGTVRYADGAPLEGGYLELVALGARHTGWIGGSGVFRVTGLAAGAYDLNVKPEWGGEPALTAAVKAGDENLALVVKTPRKERLDLRVLDADGKSVGRGSYRVAGADEGSADGTFEEGRFHVPVRMVEWSVLVYGARTSSGGSAPFGPVVAGPFPATVRSQEIRLPPETRIEGVVRAPDGHGVRGVRVSAWFLGLPAPFVDLGAEASASRTDEKGRFRIGGLATGSYRLRVAVGGGYGAIEPVDVTAGSTDVVLTLKFGDAVAPLVLDADGKPVVGVYLRAADAVTISDAETDGEGRAALEGLDAHRTYKLDVHVPSVRSDVLSQEIADWKPSDEPITLRRGHRVAGVVRDADGRPVADADVDADPSSGDTLSVTSLGDGTFELLRVPAGNVTLRATGEGEPPRRSRPVQTVAGASDVVLVLEHTTSLTVRLAAKRPLPDEARVEVHQDGGGGTDWESTSAEHTAVFSGLQPSTLYTFYADVVVEGDAHVVGIAKGVRGDAKTLTLELVDGRTVSGRVRFPIGTKDVRVSATSDGEEMGAELDEDGRFVIKGLFEGPCVVEAGGKTPGGEHLRASAKVVAGGTVELELRAER